MIVSIRLNLQKMCLWTIVLMLGIAIGFIHRILISFLLSFSIDLRISIYEV